VGYSICVDPYESQVEAGSEANSPFVGDVAADGYADMPDLEVISSENEEDLKEDVPVMLHKQSASYVVKVTKVQRRAVDVSYVTSPVCCADVCARSYCQDESARSACLLQVATVAVLPLVMFLCSAHVALLFLGLAHAWSTGLPPPDVASATPSGCEEPTDEVSSMAREGMRNELSYLGEVA